MPVMRYQPQGRATLANWLVSAGCKLAFNAASQMDVASGKLTSAPFGSKVAPWSGGVAVGPFTAGPYPSFATFPVKRTGSFTVLVYGTFFYSAGNSPLVSHYNGTAGGWKFGIQATTFTYTQYGVADYVGTVLVGDYTGVLAVVVTPGVDAKFYKGGALVQTIAISAMSASSGNGTLVVGNRAGGSDVANSSIIGGAYYIDNALTPDQIAYLSRNFWAGYQDDSNALVSLRNLRSASLTSVVTCAGSASGTSTISSTIRAIYQTAGASNGLGVLSAPTVSVFRSQAAAQSASGTSATSVSLTFTHGESTSTVSVGGNSSAVWNVKGGSTGDAGVSSAFATAVSFYESIAAAAGSSEASAAVAVLGCAAGRATGFASLEGISIAIYGASAMSISASTVEAVVASIAETVGRAEGNVTVSGVASGGAHYTAVGDRFSLMVTFSPYAIAVENAPYKITIK